LLLLFLTVKTKKIKTKPFFFLVVVAGSEVVLAAILAPGATDGNAMLYVKY
jgi:hypothetical protein